MVSALVVPVQRGDVLGIGECMARRAQTAEGQAGTKYAHPSFLPRATNGLQQKVNASDLEGGPKGRHLDIGSRTNAD